MATYVAFLRAINLGAKRKFPKDAIARATEAAGGTGVETWINTGNVRLTHGARSAAKVQAQLETAYAEETGFDVPTVVFTAAELGALAARGRALHEEHQPAGKHYVTLFTDPPDAEAVAAVHALEIPGERCVVDGRAAYALLDGGVHESRLMRSKELAGLGQGTARTIDVLTTVAGKWC